MIYCLEDDLNIQELIIYTLTNAGFKVLGFDHAQDFTKALDVLPELILLDIMLPDASGLDILKQLKQNKKLKFIPVILLTSKSSEYDKVIGLDFGADDYITKPFSIIELIARVKAILRRVSPNNNDLLVHLELQLDINKHEVTYQNLPVNLTVKEFLLLKILLENPNIVLSRERLLEEVWGYDYYGESRTVDVHIRTLRSKLGSSFDYIKTIHGVGYKLEG